MKLKNIILPLCAFFLLAVAAPQTFAVEKTSKTTKTTTGKTDSGKTSATKKTDAAKTGKKSTKAQKQSADSGKTDKKGASDTKKTGKKGGTQPQQQQTAGKRGSKASQQQAAETQKSGKKNGKNSGKQQQTAGKRGSKATRQQAADTQKSGTKTGKKNSRHQQQQQAADTQKSSAKTGKKSGRQQQQQVVGKNAGKAAQQQTDNHKTGSKTGRQQQQQAAGKQTGKTQPAQATRADKTASRQSAKVNPDEEPAQDSKQPTRAERQAAERERKRAERQQHDSLVNAVNHRVVSSVPQSMNPKGLKVNDVTTNSKKRQVDVNLNENFTHLPLSTEFINNIEQEVKDALPSPEASYRVNLNVGKDKRPLSYYINRIDRSKFDANAPFVVAKEPYVHATKGMENDVVAMWHSHGRYYKGSSGWQWQRPFLFETAEDVFTMGYVLPYIVPMLENAGAYVLLPRERDPNHNEVIVDNDTNDGGFLGSQPYYKEQNGTNKWEQGKGEGFIYDLPNFRDTENPFTGGSYREVKTLKTSDPKARGVSRAGWYADIPEEGEYAVYVSYKTLPNSTEDAHYTVNYSGGSREFIVNQTMGGGTWIYLGTFPFEAGYSDVEPVVTLDNISKKADRMVTADAVKIGGGMGNIERSPSRSDVTANPSSGGSSSKKYAQMASPDEEVAEEGESDGQEAAPAVNDSKSKGKSGRSGRFSTSGLPRFVEGARYWLHWAGIPESVYSPHHGRDDYKDDYTSRGNWVNYMAGGSRVLPNRDGLGIPVDVSFALHSDAGVRKDDSVVGTLGIYYTAGGAKYADGTPRHNSRMLTDLVMRQIVGDIRSTFEPNWTRRQMWDKSYLEAKAPEVPSTLIELLSHQNWGDMIYGLDPNFQFTVGRAIYKGLGRFVAQRKGREFIVQPLPVQSFAITREAKGKYKLSWQPTKDPLEPSAMPKKYIIFERSGGVLGFHKIAETHNTHFELKITDDEVHSFKIVAANDGGLSFPSEVLALCEGQNPNAKPALIVNGFTRVAAAGHYSQGGKAGFDSKNEFAVPYIRDISFSGYQSNDNRNAGIHWGWSNTDYVDNVIAGNTFDFVAEHGLSIGEACLGFVSCSAMALENGLVNLDNYSMVDLILGKQKTTIVGKGHSGELYTAFPAAMQQKLTSYVEKGGRLFVSGAYVASDLYKENSSDADRQFAVRVLGIAPATAKQHNGRLSGQLGSLKYNNTLNDKQYIVEHPDALQPQSSATTLLNFSDDRQAAAVASKFGNGRVVTMSVPFESIMGEDARDNLMEAIIRQLGVK